MNPPNIFQGIGDIFVSLSRGILPLLLLFFVFQLLFLKLPRGYVLNILKGILLAFIGLLLFLQGIYTGFLPAGKAIGEALGSIQREWLLVPFGLMAGFLAAFSEPAVRILSNQVEESSGGSIRKGIVLYTISLGVAASAAVGMARIVYDISLLYILIPGYLVAMILIWFSDKSFVSIAFDAGCVATGPMVVIFLTAIAMGMAATIEGRDAMIYSFGIVALMMLAPILSVLLLGLVFRGKFQVNKEGKGDGD